jgi:tetratricopeptide (TPR) repeat protein
LASEAGLHLSAAGLRAAKSGDVPAASSLLARASSLLGPATATRRDLLTERGLILWRAGDVADAEKEFETAVASAVREQDRRAELRARTELAHLRLRRAEEGAQEELLRLASEAIPIFERFDDERGLGRMWFALATAYGGFNCQYRKAAEAATRALEHFRGSEWPLASCLQELAAGLYYGPTPVPEAVARCHELQHQADRGGQALILGYLAALDAMAGQFGSARELAAEARTIYEDLAWNVNIWTNYAPHAASIELLARDFVVAEHVLAESCAMLERWGLRSQVATQATQLAEALYGQERYKEALRWSETAEAHAADYDVGAQFLWRAVRGKALARLGEPGEGERLEREAVGLALKTDSVSQCGHVLLCLAEVLELNGHSAEAGDAVERATRLFDGKGNVAASRHARTLLGGARA